VLSVLQELLLLINLLGKSSIMSPVGQYFSAVREKKRYLQKCSNYTTEGTLNQSTSTLMVSRLDGVDYVPSGVLVSVDFNK
jgi:hypothetical protein